MVPTINPPRDARPDSLFTELSIPESLVRVLDRQSIITPTPIQAATLPHSLAGRDVLGKGQTGTGKTLAFALPTVLAIASSSANRRPGQPRGLILVPTRELATQVAATIAPLAGALSLTCATIFGGVSQGKQVAALRSGVDIVIACPGRLEDLIKQRLCSLNNVVITVLDEADHLADLGFLPAVRRLLDATPAGTQRLLFSATLDSTVEALVKRYLREPSIHSVDAEPEQTGEVTHRLLNVATADKLAVVREIAASTERCLMFTRTKHGAKKLAGQLCASGIAAVELHGNLSQVARQRNLDAFARGGARVLVATDIAARGIHVDDIALVVHVDPPAEHKAYVHRSGRTARAGAQGAVITLMTPDQVSDVQRLARMAGVSASTERVSPGQSLLGKLTGPTTPAARREQTPAARPARPAGSRRRRNRRSSPQRA